MQVFDVLGDPVRRRLLELMGRGEVAAGALAAVVHDEFGISQPAVSQHLKVLREHHLVLVRAQGTRRLYTVDPAGLAQVDEWLEQFRDLWTPHLDALATEVARGKHQRRRSAGTTTSSPMTHESQEPPQGAVG
jgi:DNA-binding transcriptional ArsR family regulator